MPNVELVNDTITISGSRALSKEEALDVAAKIIHLLEDTEFAGVGEAIRRLVEEREKASTFHANLDALNLRGYQFQHMQDNWVKPAIAGVIVIPRSMLYEKSPGDFEHFLDGIENHAMSVEI